MTAAVVKYIAKQSAEDPFEFILSDETPDRYGDIIKAAGWVLANFKANPIALFGHDNSFPIGVWEQVRVVGSELRAKLVPALKGTSQRIDEIISLVEQRVLKAASVGFKPLVAPESRPGNKGFIFTRQELLETSIVTVPANPAALAVAKQLHISDETLTEVFGKSADEIDVIRRSTGKPAIHPTPRARGNSMSEISKKIEEKQAQLVALQDQLNKELEALGDDATEEQNLVIRSLNDKIANAEETLGNLVEAEKRLGSVTVERSAAPVTVERSKPWAAPAAKVEPLDFIFRAMTVKLVSHVYNKGLTETMTALYGEDIKTKAVMDRVIGIDTPFDGSGFINQKAAVAPADTATPAWAGALVQTAIGDFFNLLMPDSVYPRLSALGGRYGFGRNGTISLPTRAATPTVAGSFVGEGAPIPVRKAGFTSVSLTPKKMAVITAMTREITERSTPQIEQLLRNAIQEDTAVSIDSVLLDNNPATTIRPVGLRNGITTASGTAGGGFAAVTADLKGMLTTLVTNTNGNIRSPAFIMNPIQAIALGFVQNAGGDLVFKEEIGAGRLNGYPVIQSGTVPAGVVILIDAADFFSATGDDPRFDISDQATLHMEDTTPLAIGTAGAPATVAAPVQSMFQTDSLALRMILPMSWAMRRSGVLVERTAVSW
jgi:HK97 family phage major capsid protein/HK97 family phage prohead protease